VFEPLDINVGYCFVEMLLKSGDGQLIVDSSLLNDVKEQHGGGAEPFTNVLSDHPSVASDAAVAAAARVSADVAKMTADAAVAAGKATLVAGNSTVQAATDVAGGGSEQFSKAVHT